MASFTSENISNTPDINIPYHNGATKLIGSRQDYVICGETPEFKYHIILDGHGKGKVASTLSKITWNEVLKNHDSPKNMLENINKHLMYKKFDKHHHVINGEWCINNAHDGSTCIIVIIFEQLGIIKTFNIGDSMTGIKINDSIVFTKMHNVDNEAEVQRLRENDVKTEDAWRMKIISSKNRDASMCKGIYFNFKYVYPADSPIRSWNQNSKEDKLAMTRALGHNHGHHFATLQEFDCNTYTYTPGIDTVTIISATDGLWDILCPETSKQIFTDVETSTTPNLVEKLLDMAENLWTSTWNYHTPPGFSGYGDPPTQTKLGGVDDIGIAVYHCK